MNREEYRKQLFWKVVVPGIITCILFMVTLVTDSLMCAVLTTAVLGLAFTNLFIVDGKKKTDE